MESDKRTGKVKLRQGKAVILPAETMLILPESSRVRSVVLHIIKQSDQPIRFCKPPCDNGEN